ncbi:hypothetical protein [Bradyrhizobium sp. BR 1433]|uniref:hypothetical protein n=1 Tax=Bradyrhizobium sp. BR 1433 TaxID=3447967 RepID=UPI003EE4F2E6
MAVRTNRQFRDAAETAGPLRIDIVDDGRQRRTAERGRKAEQGRAAQLLFIGRDLLVELGDLGLERVDFGLELADLRSLGVGQGCLAPQRIELLERGFASFALLARAEKEPAFPLSRRRRGSSNSGTEERGVTHPARFARYRRWF